MATSEALMTTTGTIAALDYGEARVGVALASHSTLLPRPLTTLANDGKLFENLTDLARSEKITTFVVGLPRNLSGEDTEQTRIIRRFAKQLASQGIPVVFQDETGTSQLAEQELRLRRKSYNKGDIDALAACLILGYYLQDRRNTR